MWPSCVTIIRHSAFCAHGVLGRSALDTLEAFYVAAECCAADRAMIAVEHMIAVGSCGRTSEYSLEPRCAVITLRRGLSIIEVDVHGQLHNDRRFLTALHRKIKVRHRNGMEGRDKDKSTKTAI